MSRILAVDYGEKRVGLALSDPEQVFAFEHQIYSPADFFAKLPELVIEQDISKIIIGYPLNMSGQPTQKTAEVLAFKTEVEHLLPDMPVELIDERLSSKMAENIAGSNKNIDSLAAQIFLQNYIEKNRPKK